MEDIFDTKEKKANAIAIFQGLQEHPGWQLLVRIVTANIEVLKKQLEDGVDEETLETVREIRAKIRIHENIITTPQSMIKSFTDGEPKDIELDPYPTTLKTNTK